jgi:rhamnulose-1-phosphate aldolase
MESFLFDLVRTSRDIAHAGWAEANAGNISVRLGPAELKDRELFSQDGPWVPLAIPTPSLGGEFFLVTAKGCQIRNIADFPRRDCGVLELNPAGDCYRVVWGLEGTVPTSEFFAHLLSHAVRKERSGGAERAILHTHPVTVVALCHAMELDTVSLTRLLWSMHPEGVCLFHGGIAYLPLAMPGSQEISRMTCKAFENHSMVLWEYHGIFASGTNLDHAFGMVQAAEKTALIYQSACMMGGVRRALSDRQIQTIADNFGLSVTPGILNLSDEA